MFILSKIHGRIDHYSNIKKDGYKTLKENQLIEFEVVKTEKGYQSVDIKPVEEMQTIE